MDLYENDNDLLQIVDSIQDILDDHHILPSSESDMELQDSFYSFGAEEICLSISKISGNSDKVYSKVSNMMSIMESRIGIELRRSKCKARNYTHIYISKIPF